MTSSPVDASPIVTPFPVSPWPSHRHRALIADDEAPIRWCCRTALERVGVDCEEASDGLAAIRAVRHSPFDLLVLDVDMPQLTGPDVLRQIRGDTSDANLKIILISGRFAADELANYLVAGADDYLAKPLSVIQLQARAKAALRLRDAQVRSNLLNRHLADLNGELEHCVSARDSDLVEARNALVLALAKVVESRDNETGSHLMRLQHYCRCLAAEAARTTFADDIDSAFVDMLVGCAPLHDIGKVGIPDRILLKPGRFDDQERSIMQQHTVIGAETLLAVAKQHRFAIAFLQMAADIARHHHERYDGAGYPDRLLGSDIPLAARLVAVCDVYDALRSERTYKAAIPHARTVQIMTAESPGQFDPALLEAFSRCHAEFERLYRATTE